MQNFNKDNSYSSHQ